MCTAPSTYPVHRPTRVERLSIQCTVTYESACMMSVLSFSSHSRKSYNIQPVRARRRRPVHGRSIHQSRDRASCAPWPAGPSSPARRRTDIDACMDRPARPLYSGPCMPPRRLRKKSEPRMQIAISKRARGWSGRATCKTPLSACHHLSSLLPCIA